MDQADIKLEGSTSNDNVSNENTLFTVDFERNIKVEATTSSKEYDASIKMEKNISDINIHHERCSFSKNLGKDMKNNTTTSNYGLEMDSQIIIKEEPIFSDAELSNLEYLDCTNLKTEIKSDTITDDDYKMDIKIESSMQESVSYSTMHLKEDHVSVDLMAKLEKDNVNCSGSDAETTIKTEIDFQLEISQANTEKNDLEAKDPISSASPRSARDAVYHDGSFLTFPDAFDFNPGTVNYHNKQTSMRTNICTPNFDPLCGSEASATGKNITLIYKCKVCGNNLDSLRVGPSQQKLYTDATCEKCLEAKSELKTDPLILSAGKEVNKCNICEKCYTTKKNLNKHIKIVHSGTKPYKCEHCNKYFTRSSSLNLHNLLHSGTKAYKCEHCEKSYTRKVHLNEHKLLHLAVKPYKCDQCQQSFTRKSSLQQHGLLHLNIKPHKCEDCGKCFRHKSHLRTHILLHTGLKPYRCEHCEKCFTRNSNLRKHKLLH